jgi:hypothetical protein
VIFYIKCVTKVLGISRKVVCPILENSVDSSELSSGMYLMSLMMEAVRTSETSVDNHFTRQYIPEDNSELHTRPRENLKSHSVDSV